MIFLWVSLAPLATGYLFLSCQHASTNRLTGCHSVRGTLTEAALQWTTRLKQKLPHFGLRRLTQIGRFAALRGELTMRLTFTSLLLVATLLFRCPVYVQQQQITFERTERNLAMLLGIKVIGWRGTEQVGGAEVSYNSCSCDQKFS